MQQQSFTSWLSSSLDLLELYCHECNDPISQTQGWWMREKAAHYTTLPNIPTTYTLNYESISLHGFWEITSHYQTSTRVESQDRCRHLRVGALLAATLLGLGHTAGPPRSPRNRLQCTTAASIMISIITNPAEDFLCNNPLFSTLHGYRQCMVHI